MKKIFASLLIALLLALMTIPVLALQTEPPAPFEIPDVFQIAILGFLTYWIVEGLKLIYPPLAGRGPMLAAAVVAILLDLISGAVSASVPQLFWPIVTQVLIVVSTWLISQGTKRIEKNFRAALSAK